MADVEKGFIKARIDEDWAHYLTARDVYEFSHYRADGVFGEVRIRQLGGLTITCTDKEYDWAEVVEIGHRRSTVNLARDQVGRLTGTVLLHKAAAAQRGSEDELAQQLLHRQTPTSLHGSDETWVIPVSALEVIDHVASTRTD